MPYFTLQHVAPQPTKSQINRFEERQVPQIPKLHETTAIKRAAHLQPLIDQPLPKRHRNHASL